MAEVEANNDGVVLPSRATAEGRELELGLGELDSILAGSKIGVLSKLSICDSPHSACGGGANQIG